MKLHGSRVPGFRSARIQVTSAVPGEWPPGRLPLSTAYTAACTRLERLSLRNIPCTWIFTVLSATPRSRAISLLLAPRASSSRISRSRGESFSWAVAAGGALSCAGFCSPATSLPVMPGATTASPRAARRTASEKNSASMFFSR
jgi:hypothetical protein